MDIQELWRQVCDMLRAELTRVTFDTLIGNNLTPAKLEDDVFTLCITLEKVRTVVDNRYAPMIAECVKRITGRTVTISILTRAELEEEERRKKIQSSPDNISMQFDPRYTFDTFVVGSHNRLAHAAALAVAEAPAEAYNPLYIYGGVGLGKTHLMHAIGHYIQQQYPEKRLLYTTSENFTNELIVAIGQNRGVSLTRNMEFRARFRNVDVLMVDDIQFIAGRDSTQEEFFHTFNALYGAGKQIILTSDKLPNSIPKLEERLATRFAWGMTADISRPDLETRIAILREKARREQMVVPDDVMELIAANIDSNIRELEGCLTRLVAYAKLVNEPITVSLCQDALRDVIEKKSRRAINADVIMKVVCEYYNIKVEDMISSTRRREIAVPRQIAIYLTRELTGLSLPQIGVAFGNRDHSTVLHSCNLVASNIKNSSDLTREVNDLRQMIIDG